MQIENENLADIHEMRKRHIAEPYVICIQTMFRP